MKSLLVLLALHSASASSSPASPPTAACQAVLDMWCGADGSCPLAVDGFLTPALARFNLQNRSLWRCYSPSALDKSRTRYVGGAGFCTRPQLAHVLAVCEGSQPPPYPVPPAAAAAHCNGDPAPVTAPSIVMANGYDSTACYRIPSVVSFGSDSDAVLVFAEARESNCADSGKHALAATRSTDRGKTWSPIEFLLNDTDPRRDGLNLGASVYDAARKTVHVLFNECADAYGRPPCGPTAQLLLVSSTDFGKTWGPLRNLTSTMVAGGFAMLNPGPGTGVQIHPGGRLVVPAWGDKLGQGIRGGWNAVALLSDDGGGSWRVGKPAPNPGASKPNELQAATGCGGQVVLNVRDEASQVGLAV